MSAPPTAERGNRPTTRELEVLSYVAAGFRNEEIAAELVVGFETVKSHMRSVSAKLGARNRAHAACIALYLGLIAPATVTP